MNSKHRSHIWDWPEHPNLRQAYQYVAHGLRHVYESGEARAVADELFLRLLGMTRDQRILWQQERVKEDALQALKMATAKLFDGYPVQYVTGVCSFLDREFDVCPGVLIPRPETEELVLLTKKIVELRLPAWQAQGEDSISMLDVGTGSGCIIVSLAAAFPDARMYACDVSESALNIAAQNAKKNAADVSFYRCNMLDNWLPGKGHQSFHCIVSNPPYVRLSEKTSMADHVIKHEPPEALFVPDDNPLIFYKAIISEAASLLIPGGLLIFEINEAFGEDMVNLMKLSRYCDVTLCKDLHGRDRFVYGMKANN